MARPTIHDALPERIQCTARQHHWEDVPDDGRRLRAYRESSSVSRVTSWCPHCKSKKYEVWSKVTGDIITTPAYVYPYGYSMPGAGLKKKNFRKAWLSDFRPTMA